MDIVRHYRKVIAEKNDYYNNDANKEREFADLDNVIGRVFQSLKDTCRRSPYTTNHQRKSD